MDYGLPFLAGLFGSMHCVGMCGPIVLSYSTNSPTQPPSLSRSLSAHLTYNLGRILSYTLVGGILGGIGSGVLLLKDLGYWFSLLAGVLMVFTGISLLRVIPFLSSPATLSFEQTTKNIFFRAYRAVYSTLLAHQSVESKFYLGLLTPLLPCGLLYSMFLKAASSATVAHGALTMFSFGLGIAPALILTGFAGRYVGGRLRSVGDKLGAATILVMGVVLIGRAIGIPFFGGAVHHH
jgi:sulfite exporter TauE/SafE